MPCSVRRAELEPPRFMKPFNVQKASALHGDGPDMACAPRRGYFAICRGDRRGILCCRQPTHMVLMKLVALRNGLSFVPCGLRVRLIDNVEVFD